MFAGVFATLIARTNAAANEALTESEVFARWASTCKHKTRNYRCKLGEPGRHRLLG